jgi:hypothetical protein
MDEHVRIAIADARDSSFPHQREPQNMRSFLPPAVRSRHAFVLGVVVLLSAACSDSTRSPITAPTSSARLSAGRAQDVAAAIAAQERHNAALFNIPGVIGTAVGLLPSGAAAIRVYVTRPDMPELPPAVDGVPLDKRVTAQFMALSDPTKRARPAPLGFSVGHPTITAGTIGANVVDAAGVVYILSNNHVLAASNNASIGDAEYQPGPFDGGTAADQIGTLAAFRPINFSGVANPFDGAIARVTNPADLLTNTPLDDGYGSPSATIAHDANGDGNFDDIAGLLNVPVQKFGRTTKLTHDFIDAVNGSVTVCYESFFGFCTKSALYTGQLIINASGFSGGGDSGSLIVTNDGNKNPIALLFAGSSTQTIANRIDLVLNYFNVHINAGEPPPPPTPLTDAAVQSVSAPASVLQGTSATVSVTVRNVGNQNVGSFDVSLQDATDNVAIGTQTVASLAAGASATLSFSWNTTGGTLGSHTLTATHTLTDDNAANNQASTTVQVADPSSASQIHIGDLDGFPQNNGNTWSATVDITVVDGSNTPVNGATVVGTWNVSGLNSNTCTTGEGGGNGTCIVLFPSLKKATRSVTFTVTSVTLSGRTYSASANTDPDGSSNGTTIVVNKP